MKKEIVEYVKQYRPDTEQYKGEAIAHLVELIFNKMMKRNNNYFVRFGLTFAQFEVLALIWYLSPEEGLSQLELSRRMCVTQGNITRIVDRMIREDLVSKAEWQEDRRYNKVRLTPKGLDLFLKSYKGFEKLVGSYSKDFKNTKRLEEFLMEWLYNLRED